MALSGSLTTNAYAGVRSLTLTWSATQNIAGNQSTVNWTLAGSGSTANYNPYYYSGPFRVTINGSQAYYSTARIQLRSGTVVASGSTTIPHNADGTKTFSIRVEGAIYATSINCTAEQSFTLNQIPRAATLLSAPDFTDEDNPTIQYSNPAGANIYAYLEVNGIHPAEIRQVYGSSYTFQLTNAERNLLRQATLTSNTTTIRFVLRTDIGTTPYYSWLDRTLTIKNPKPILNPTVVDGNSATVALTGSYAKLVKYYSDAKITFGASAVKGATIKSKKVTCGSKSLTADGTIQDVESGTFSLAVTDSRGNTTTKTVNQTMVNYIKLTCDVGSGVPEATGKFTFRVTGNFFNASFGAVANTLNVKYRYRAVGGTYSEYKDMTVSKFGNSYTATVNLTGLDYTKTYQFQAQAVDKLATVTSLEKMVRATPVFDWSETDFNFNVPVTVQGQGLARCGMTATFYQSNGAGLTDLQDKTVVPLRTVREAYGGAELSGGGIKVANDGIYLICGSVHYTGGTNGQWAGVYVYDQQSFDCGAAYTAVMNGAGTVVTPTTIRKLNSGAVIKLRAEAAGGGIDVPNDGRSRLTVIQVF